MAEEKIGCYYTLAILGAVLTAGILLLAINRSKHLDAANAGVRTDGVVTYFNKKVEHEMTAKEDDEKVTYYSYDLYFTDSSGNKHTVKERRTEDKLYTYSKPKYISRADDAVKYTQIAYDEDNPECFSYVARNNRKKLEWWMIFAIVATLEAGYLAGIRILKK